MAGNSIGQLFRVTTCGESHGVGLMAIVDGVPPGLELTADDLQKDLDRRKPGTSKFATQRKEPDEVEIISGVFEGKTTGTSIGLLIRNTDQKSKDYGNIAQSFRPGHADYTYTQKYGFRDYRGGGRSSARETAMRVAAGAIAKKYLAEKFGILIRGHVTQIGTEIAEKLDFLGAYLFSNSNQDYVTISVCCIEKHLPEVVNVVSDFLFAPTFPEDKLATHILKRQEQYKIDIERVEVLSQKIFRQALFGQNHPYGAACEMDDFSKIKRKTLLIFMRNTT